MDAAGGQLVADLLRLYGVNLGDVLTGGLSPRFVLELVRGLPSDCPSAALLREEKDAAGWGVQEYLTAALIDVVRENNYITAQGLSKRKLKQPEPLKVPGVDRKKRSAGNGTSFTRMAAAQLAAHSARE